MGIVVALALILTIGFFVLLCAGEVAMWAYNRLHTPRTQPVAQPARSVRMSKQLQTR